MWFFAAFFIIGFILSAFFGPKAKIENARAAQLSDFNFPRASEGSPVPRIYGTVKTLGVNTIGECNFQAVPITTKVKTGLFSSKKQTIGYKYLIGLDLGVCLGPCVVFRRMWYGKNLIWAGCLYGSPCDVQREYIDLPELLGGKDQNGGIQGWIALYPGAFDQSSSAYLQTNLATDGDIFPSYPGIAHMVFEDFYWGNSANIEAIAVEVSYFSNSLGLSHGKHVMSNGLDANPVEVLYDLYVNGWGNLGVTDPVFNVPNWQAIAYQIYDEGNGISLEIANPNSGADLSKEVLRQINAVIFTDPSTGEINIKLMRQDYDIATLPVLGPNEIASLNNFTKKLWKDTFNRVRIAYKDRDNNYGDAIALADDFGNLRYQSRVVATDVSYPGVYVGDLANSIAARDLSNLSVPLYQGDLTLDRTHTELLPGSVFVLQWPEYNIVGIVVRINKMSLGQRKDGKVTMNVVQDEFASDAVVMGTPPSGLTDGRTYGPTNITTSAIVETPYWIDNASALGTRAGYTRYMSFAKKPGGASLDYFAMIDNGDDDIEALANGEYTATAQLTAALGQFDGFAVGNLPTLTVGSLSSADALANGSKALLQSTGQGLLYFKGEILGYETFVDNGDGTYTLNNVHRALMDTAPVAGAIGEVVYIFDGQAGVWDTDVPIAPLTTYLQDRSITGRTPETTSPHFVLAPIGRLLLALPPDYVQLAGSRSATQIAVAGDNVTFDWRERNRTAAAIAVEDDATQAAEAGTTYDLEVCATDGTVLQTEAAIAAATVTFVLDAGLAPQNAIAKVWAVKSGDRSYAPGLFPFTIVEPSTLIVDGDPVLVDGSTVEL